MRTLVSKANVINISVVDPTAPVQSDKLFQGRFGHKTLIHSLLLKFKIVYTGEADPGLANLGNITLKTSEGDYPPIPLRMLANILPYLGTPVYQIPASGTEWTCYIPVPFALLKGCRPKDGYVVAEKCNDYYIELSGAVNGVTLTSFRCTPILIGEANNNVAIPSDCYLKYTTDEIPAGVDYMSKVVVIGAGGWIAIQKSDYADFVAGDHLRLYVDGVKQQEYESILDCSRVWNSVLQSHGQHIGADTTPDDLILVPLTLDKKMAKISRNSQVQLEFFNSGQAEYTIRVMYQPIRPLTSAEAFKLAKRQNPNLQENDLSIQPLPVDLIGNLNPIAKPIFRKPYQVTADNKTERVKNTI